MEIQKAFFADIKNILAKAKQQSYAYANSAMLDAYWKVGKRIVEEEQKGERRAKYGSFLIKELAEKLSAGLGKGFDERELRRMRQFYLFFPIREALRPELTWTHYRCILRVDIEKARQYYVNESITAGWTSRQLERNVSSQYYQRLLSTQKSNFSESIPNHDKVLPVPSDLIKDPYFLEFLGIERQTSLSEHGLEMAIIDKLQQFLLELGKGFAFVARQYQVRTDTKEFYIDLVFYNYILKCFVLVDLKISELSHQDIGQMDMYVRLFEGLKKGVGDNPTIGIILCSDKDETIVKYSVLNENKQLFASKYRLFLPTENELIEEIQREKSRINKF